jgi:Flp pilus assembly protein TadG
MLHRDPSRRERRRAVAAVELAIVASFILIPAAYGMIEVARAVQVKDCLTDVARSACRVAITAGNANSDVTSNISTTLTANGLTVSQTTTTIQVNGVTADVRTAVQYDKISVKISIPIHDVSYLLPYFFSSSSVDSETLIMMRQG